ncbi:MAG: hypothetical protein GTO14_20485 [Anaerolineales bacterium]|nr:hypothetical protein [Anaerolineales bacterium]
MTRLLRTSVALLALMLSACSSFSRPPAKTVQVDLVPTQTVRFLPTRTATAIVEEEPVLDTVTPMPTDSPRAISPSNASQIMARRVLEGHLDDVSDVAFSPDGDLVASASMDGTVRIWRTADGELVRTIEAHEDHVLSLDFSPDGEYLVTGSDDRTTRLWRVAEGELVWEVGTELVGRILKVAFSPDGTLVALGGHRCYIELRATRSGILRRTLAQPRCVAKGFGAVGYWGMAFSRDGSQIFTGEGRSCCGGSLQLWQVEEYIAPELIRGYNLAVRDVASSPDGEHLAVAFVGNIDFWLLKPEEPYRPQVFVGHTFRVNSVAFSPQGELIASASRDGTIRIWSVQSGETLTVLEGHEDGVNRAVFSADGSMLASASQDDTVIIWDLP